MTLSPAGHGHGSFGHGQGSEDTVVNTVVVGSAQLNDSSGVGVGAGSPTAVSVATTGEIVGRSGATLGVAGPPGKKGEKGEKGDAEGVSERDAPGGGADWMGPPGLVLVSVAPATSESEAQVAQRPHVGGLPTSRDTVQSSEEVIVAVVGPEAVGPVGSPIEQMEVGSTQAMRQTSSGLVKVAVRVGVAQDEISGA